MATVKCNRVTSEGFCAGSRTKQGDGGWACGSCGDVLVPAPISTRHSKTAGTTGTNGTTGVAVVLDEIAQTWDAPVREALGSRPGGRTKVYLSGPMTGLPDLNYPAFNEAAARLRERGYEVYNPAEWEEKYNGGEFNLTLAFADYCHYICREADMVAVLPGWENSPGATAETSLAGALRKPVVTVAALLGEEG